MDERRARLRHLIKVYDDFGEWEDFYILTAHSVLDGVPIFKSLYEDTEALITYIELIIDRGIYRDVTQLLYDHSLELLGINGILEDCASIFYCMDCPKTAFKRLKQYIAESDDNDYSERTHEIFNVINNLKLPKWFVRQNRIATMQFLGPLFKYLDPLRLGEERTIKIEDLISAGVTHKQIMSESGLSYIFEGLTIKEGNEFIEEFLSDKPLALLTTHWLRDSLLTFLRSKIGGLKDESECMRGR